MKSYLLNALDDIRSSYWFIPALMAFASVLLSFGAIQLDAHFAGSINEDWLGWLFNNQPEGAREVLSTIAGSMITVAGVIFSITLVSVSNAAFQFGPRLLTNFMRDRANQITLGTFIATFLYCLMVLRAVRSVPPSTSGGEAASFVPHIALLIALILAVCSIMVLIYFIHHVPRSIHVSRLVANVGEELCSQLDHRFPTSLGNAHNAENSDVALSRFQQDLEGAEVLNARSTGYIRIMDNEGLMSLARKYDLKMELLCEAGDFITKGQPVIRARACGEDIQDECRGALVACLTCGEMRTPFQDIGFLVQELGEIACRALSPGINDPVTANTCMDWLGAALTLLAERAPISPLRADEDGTPRVLAPATGFESILGSGLDMIFPFAARNQVAAKGFMRMMNRLEQRTEGTRREHVIALRNDFLSIARSELTKTEYKAIEQMMESDR